jgi:hypothetical protein
MRRPLVIYDFATAPLGIFVYMRKIGFSFLSVWCTIELKVIGNLECRIKFYREKKPRHFFYTIEYPYPPTNSVG